MKLLFVSDQPWALVGLAIAARRLDRDAALLLMGSQESALTTFTDQADVDLVVVDFDGAGAGWLDCTAWLAAIDPSVPLAVLASSGDSVDIARALDAGACGYLLKTASVCALGNALRAMLAGQSVVPAMPVHPVYKEASPAY